MNIKWTLNELRSRQHEPIKLNGTLDGLTEELLQRSQQIISVEAITIDGWLIVDSADEMTVDASIDVCLTLPSTRSLTPVAVSFTVDFSETYISPEGLFPSDLDDTQKVFIQLEQDTLDLQKPIIDSILVSLPTKVLTQAEQTSHVFPTGDDWQVLSEGDQSQIRLVDEGNSPFSALKALFSDEDHA